MLCEASNVTKMWTQTTAHTIPIHLLGCRTEINPTVRVYVQSATSLRYGSNLTIERAHSSGKLSNRGGEALGKPEDVAIRVVERNRGDSKGIRFSPITHDAFLRELLT